MEPFMMVTLSITNVGEKAIRFGLMGLSTRAIGRRTLLGERENLLIKGGIHTRGTGWIIMLTAMGFLLISKGKNMTALGAMINLMVRGYKLGRTEAVTKDSIRRGLRVVKEYIKLQMVMFTKVLGKIMNFTERVH
jgi:hypothetical protein